MQDSIWISSFGLCTDGAGLGLGSDLLDIGNDALHQTYLVGNIRGMQFVDLKPNTHLLVILLLHFRDIDFLTKVLV